MEQKQILVMIPYAIFPLRGGGALRCFHLLRQLARFHEVHVIVFQRKEELQKESEGYKLPASLRIYSPVDTPAPKSALHFFHPKLANALRYRWLTASTRGPAEGELLQCHHLVRHVLTTQTIDVAVFEHRGTMKASSLVRKLSPRTRLILDAHNVDHQLLAAEFNRNGASAVDRSQEKMIARAKWEESNLARFVDAVWCCSDLDQRVLAEPSKIPGYVIPNGVDCSFFSFDANPAKSRSSFVLFSGAMNTEANKDAVDWLLTRIWPLLVKRLPALRLLLVGRGLAPDLAEKAGRSRGVEMVGEVNDVRPYFRKASLALVPLRIGSGTRLKIMEAMAQGNPVISTSKGAEGLNVTDGENILFVEEPERFAKAAEQLLNNPAGFESIRRNARTFVEKNHDWDVVGESANRALKEICQIPSASF